MGEVIRFVSKSEREPVRLIREARAIYESIFPPADPLGELQDKTSTSHTVGDGNVHRTDGGGGLS
ncbi:hypothetical protein [Bradyrhizobium genosp. P]|uniref:hypothetical protein n=1 Tax=Bradyrhizobium genosp. P TaxID=83641 RepID=UPI003CF1BF8D